MIGPTFYCKAHRNRIHLTMGHPGRLSIYSRCFASILQPWYDARSSFLWKKLAFTLDAKFGQYLYDIIRTFNSHKCKVLLFISRRTIVFNIIVQISLRLLHNNCHYDYGIWRAFGVLFTILLQFQTYVKDMIKTLHNTNYFFHTHIFLYVL